MLFGTPEIGATNMLFGIPELRVAMLLLGIMGDTCFGAKDVVTIVNMMISGGKVPYYYEEAAPAVDVAMEKLRVAVGDRVDVNYVRLLYKPPCDANHVGAMAAEAHCAYNVSVFIGPGCSLAAEVVGRMAASWNIPMISPVATNSLLGNKKDFSTLTRLFHNWNKWGNMYLSLFQLYGWTNIAIIHDTNHVFFQYEGIGLATVFLREGFAVYIQSYLSTRTYDMRQLLVNANKKSRVFVLAMNGEQLRHTMLLAHGLGMTAGEFVFISARATIRPMAATGNMHWQRGDDLDSAARTAYDAVLITQVRRPTSAGFVAFEEEVVRRALRDYNHTYIGNMIHETIPVFHDAIMVYAHVLNETLTLGGNYQDGRFLNTKLWGKTFTGISGDIPIDEQGDRDMDFSLVDVHPVTGDYQVVAHYLGRYKGIVFEEHVSIHWPNNAGPPPNVPPCWFEGDNPACHTTGLSVEMVFGVVVSVIFLAFAVATLAVYRKVKSEADLQSRWWKVKWSDINKHVINSRMGSNISSMQSTMRGASSTDACDNADIVKYKGLSVVIKKLNIKCVPMDRATLTELRQIRDMECPNVTRFLGLCPEAPNICFITEHCPRGSLQDMLHNDAIKLDNDFKMSLLNDIITGMRYIHGSPIHCHGRLNSGNCLIDSRFVLKITDHGLPSIRRQVQVQAGLNQQDRLYVAPEHLRGDHKDGFSQPGDVYSFAIVLHELLTRNEPYDEEMDTNTTTELLDRIERADPPIRPKLPTIDVHPELLSLIKDCWHEEPGYRPSFAVIRKRYRDKLQGASGRNILDRLLQRMEQYADNLEGLVEERTHAFLEEKRKSDELLLEILPRSVAEKLKNGVPVDPEAYDGVTIYFSDIVGFTTISSHSTPFQVIDLLNDLYTCFDTIINHFDVYKVETIGDAYMVVSGLPVRNGHDHVVHIARMSLSILQSLGTFKIRHLPTTPLRARIGLHTGSVCSGVVGQKMPRYCLFGDTVNTASRLESTGEAMKIHISEPTKSLLSKMGNFHIDERGEIYVKGKGKMRTFWLVNEITDAAPPDGLVPVSS